MHIAFLAPPRTPLPHASPCPLPSAAYAENAQVRAVKVAVRRAQAGLPLVIPSVSGEEEDAFHGETGKGRIESKELRC
jgi:hypothetical protein